MPKSTKSNATTLRDHIRRSDIERAIDLVNNAIQSDKQKLLAASSPLELMKYRAEKAEARLKASDTALEALKSVQKNNYEMMKAGEVSVLTLKEIIKAKNEDAILNKKALDEMAKVIQMNAFNLSATTRALRAVNHLALTDELTGLPNRRLLSDRLQQIIRNNKRWDSYSAAIFIDLDKFKLFNDRYGHEAGDKLLISFGARLKKSVREMDTVARYGGDEFVILLASLNGNFREAKAEAAKVANKILTTFIPPYLISIHDANGLERTIKYQNLASLGVAIFNGHEVEESSILDWADEAMYWAKSDGGNTVRFYDPMNSTEKSLMGLYDMATQNDIETSNHGIRTRQYMRTLANRAKQMNLFPGALNDQIIERLFRVTQLHDIGKTKIAYSIIHKNTKLTPLEWEEMKMHTLYGAQILETAKKQNASLDGFLDTAIEVVKYHHEHWDGTGYPEGLVGNATPLSGRMMAIVDVYDALISKRSYKDAWTHQDAVNEIVAKSGIQFDPLLVNAFARESDNFALIAKGAKD